MTAVENLTEYQLADLDHYAAEIRGWARYPEYFPAAVATYAVRNILRDTDAVFLALCEIFGTPTEKDWAKAQELYGPNPRYPGASLPDYIR